MTSYYTRAKARSELEPEDVEQGDSALVTTTITASNTTPVGLQVESTGEFESMATEMAGPMATHPQLLPEGGHPSVGGHGISGSANSPPVGVSTLGYPSGPADPLDGALASSAEVLTTADATQTTIAPGNEPITSRQPPTVADMTAAASRSPTHLSCIKISGKKYVSLCEQHHIDRNVSTNCVIVCASRGYINAANRWQTCQVSRISRETHFR